MFKVLGANPTYDQSASTTIRSLNYISARSSRVKMSSKKPSVGTKLSNFKSWFVFFTILLTLLFVYHVTSLYNNVSYLANNVTIIIHHTNNDAPKIDGCNGKYIYVHDLPRRLNEEILENCNTLNLWVNMCNYLVNSGLGPLLNDSEVFDDLGWYGTHQFSLEVLFHSRMKQYRCLTNDSSKAAAVFVPYYAGLDLGRYLWEDVTLRDAASLELVEYLKKKPEWKKMSGRDHFLVVGRITWDFGRALNKSSGWGNSLLVLPEIQNMTSLIIEKNVRNDKEIAIPYPTYFHPSSDEQVFSWQDRMRRQTRPYLFSFAGGPRPKLDYTLRNEIISQCLGSDRYCKFLECDNSVKNCENPRTVMKLFEKSVFCLQPPGDSFTRRSAFDAILAGCIPVFFHPFSAYDQYIGHLPKNYTSYSVYIPTENVRNNANFSIEKRLLEIPKDEVIAMREEVLRLIPRVTFANPNSRLETLEDAFDVTVTQVLNRIKEMKSSTARLLVNELNT